MGFLSPVFFTLLPLPVLVIIFYMFRKQYEQKIIPANFLWEQVMNEWQASPWLDKLQRNLLLFLQLLIILLLILALVRPYWSVKGIIGDHIIFIIDQSASMAATHDGSTRFEMAKEELQMLLKQVDNQQVTIISASNPPRLILNKETDLKKVRNVVENLEITYETAQMEKAIKLANSLASNQEAALFILSDSVIEENLEHVSESLPVTVINNGKKADNISLQSFGTGFQDGKVVGVAIIENQSASQTAVHFQIKSAEEILFNKTVELKPNKETIVKIPELPTREFYQAEIQANDAYSIDNEAVSVLQEPQQKIYTIGDVSPFIIKGLENIGKEVIQLDQSYTGSLADGIVVAENTSLAKLPHRPILAFAPQKNNEVELRKKIEITNDPLFQYVNFDQTYVKSAYKYKQPLALETIANSGDIPLIQKGTMNSHPAVVVHFSVENSDWPLQAGFPIFLYHTTEWLTSQSSFYGFFQPGEKRWLNVDAENPEWKIFTETGEFLRSFNLEKESFTAPQQPGIYQLLNDGTTSYFAVNLDDKEKAIAWAPSFKKNQIQQKSHGEVDVKPYEHLWFWLALVGLLVLFIEWEVTRRGNRI